MNKKVFCYDDMKTNIKIPHSAVVGFGIKAIRTMRAENEQVIYFLEEVSKSFLSLALLLYYYKVPTNLVICFNAFCSIIT